MMNSENKKEILKNIPSNKSEIMMTHGVGKTVFINYLLSQGEDPKLIEKFVNERSKLHELRAIEEEKTKRLSLILSVGLSSLAGLIIVFAPTSKEFVSNIFAFSFLIGSVGLAGYKRFWFKAKFIESKADSDSYNDGVFWYKVDKDKITPIEKPKI